MNSVYMSTVLDSKLQSAFDSVKCQICMEFIENSYMCPGCKRCGCEECLKEWVNQHHTCPNCRKRIQFGELIKMPFIDDISKVLIDIEKDKCAKHIKKEEYYCQDCGKKLCSECVIVDKHDSSHRITAITERNYEKIELIALRRKQIREYINYVKERLPGKIKEKINELKEEKETKVNFLESVIAKLKNRYDSIIEKLKQLYLNIQEEVDTLLNMSIQIEDTKMQSTNTSKMIIEVNDMFNYLNTKNNIINSIIDPFNILLNYQSFSFEIGNYIKIIKEKEPSMHTIISPIYTVNFLSWQLSFTSWNSQTNKNEASLYLALKEGKKDKEYLYDYKFEIVGDNNVKYTMEDCCWNFVPFGEMKGHPQFYNLNLLSLPGLIQQNGNVLIKCYIRPHSIETFREELLIKDE